MDIYMFLGLAGGLGLFLYGMQAMAEGLQKAAGERLRRILELFTSHPLVAVLTGAIVTVLVQSSSATTVMIIGFVNAGLMNLIQAVGTIMGANIGTTITAQIVSFDISHLALPAIALGFALNFLSKSRVTRYVGQSILGFGILFLGLTIMSDSLKPLRDFQPFIDLLVKLGRTPIFGVLAGMVFTMIIQSSSATTGIVIALSLQNLISFDSGLSIILGANVGTCITALLASIGASLTARRAAVAHVLFNVLGVLIALILLKPFSQLVLSISPNVVARQIANAHTIFNISTSVILLPFIKIFVNIVTKILPGEEEILECKPKFLDRRMLHSPAAILNATQEIKRMADLSLDMLKEAVEAFINNDTKMITDIRRKEEVVNELERSITAYLSDASQNPMTTKQYHLITSLMHNVNDIERVADHATNISELALEKIEKNIHISEVAMKELDMMYSEVIRIYTKAIELLQSDKREEAELLIREDDLIDKMEREFRENHIQRLNEGLCTPDSGMLFLDLISNLERVADHANNVAEAVAGVYQRTFNSIDNKD